MAEGDKASARKFFGSFFQVVPWLKDLRTIATIVIIAFVGFTVWRAYFMKTQTQHQTTGIVALPGSTVVYSPQQSQKQEGPKRPWWLPHVFGEIYGFAEQNTDSTHRTGLGTKGGLRWEW